MTNKCAAAVALLTFGDFPPALLLWTRQMICWTNETVWCGPERWIQIWTLPDSGVFRITQLPVEVTFAGHHIPHLFKHPTCHLTFYPPATSILMCLQYVHSTSGLSLSPFPTFLASFASAHAVSSVHQSPYKTLKVQITGGSPERDHPSVQLPSTSTPGETLPKEWPGTGKPLLQFKLIPLPFYLLLFGCRGNVLHSDLGALIQSARYLPQEPP